MSKVNYEFILFGSPRAQSGVVIAYPPDPSCPIKPMVVAYANELSSPNPMVLTSTGMTTLGMLDGICGAVSGARYGMFIPMMKRIEFFYDLAHLLGITLSQYTDYLVDQYSCEDPSLQNYLRDELESYEDE